MVTRLDAAYDAQVLAVRAKVESYAQRLWNGLPSYRDADAERLIAALVPRVEAGQARVAQLTDAYVSRLAAVETGGAILRGDVADSSTLALRGVSSDEVYNRPFVTLYTNLSNGSTLTAAVTAGGARLASLVSTGMQLSKTHSARNAMGRSGITTYERVLTGRENCALCVIASTQRYHRGDLLPIHPGCDCGVRPGSGDPNQQIINADLLERIHSAVEAEFGTSDRGARLLTGDNSVSDYLDLTVTHEHGEIGPVLAWRGQHFSRGADIS